MKQDQEKRQDCAGVQAHNKSIFGIIGQLLTSYKDEDPEKYTDYKKNLQMLAGITKDHMEHHEKLTEARYDPTSKWGRHNPTGGVNKMVPSSDFADGLSPVEAHGEVLYITVRPTPVQNAINNGSHEFSEGQMENCQMIQLAVTKAYEEREILNRLDCDNVDPEQIKKKFTYLVIKVETPLKTCWEITRLYLKMCEEATTKAEEQGIVKKTRESEIKLTCIMISTVLESVEMDGPSLPFFALFEKLVKTFVYNGRGRKHVQFAER
jgi:hypothetical protein